MKEAASLLWNKVLQTSLSFTGAGSGAGVGSGSLCSGAHCRPVSVVVLVLLPLSLLVSPSSSSVLLLRRSTATGCEEACGGSRSMDPTADVLLPRISCSLPIRVYFSIWVDAEGGLLLWCAALRLEDRRRPVLTKKNSSCSLDFVVISCFIKVLPVRRGCTVHVYF